MDKERLKYVLAETERMALPHMYSRSLKVPLASGKIVVLVGIRRCGKTFILFDLIKRLMAQGVDRRQILHLSFEDDRLLPLKSEELDLILQAHSELHPEILGKPRYFVFDEIQNAPGWETFIRRLHDSRVGGIFLTGSSSQLLSREIATGLRGRCLSYEVFPLSFGEYLGFRGISAEAYSKNSDAILATAFDEYLDTGGLPEVVLAEESLRQRILREYFDLVFYRDLLERHKLSNPVLLKELLRYCLSSPATLLNPHRLYLDMKSRGISLGKDTLYRYLQHMEQGVFIYLLPIADRSLRRQAVNPKKLQVVDVALGRIYRPGAMMDRGRRLENMVFLHHRRQREDLAYLAGPAEIDLVVGSEDPELWVNSAWSLGDDDTWQREMVALQRPKGPERRLLITREPANRVAPKGTEIIEAWRYLLS